MGAKQLLKDLSKIKVPRAKLSKINSKDLDKKPNLNSELNTPVYNEDSYLKAMNGGKHSGWARDYINKPTKEIKNGIKTLEKQIELHKNKIKNPEKYYPDFKKLDIREQEANIHKVWPRDIAKQQEQKNILEGILRNREQQ